MSENFNQNLLIAFRDNERETVDRLGVDNAKRHAEIRDDEAHGGRTLFHYAAQNGWTDVCRKLVDRYHVDPDAQGSDGRTPLHCACAGRRLDAMHYIVVHLKCQFDIHDNNGNTPLMCCPDEATRRVMDQYINER